MKARSLVPIIVLAALPALAAPRYVTLLRGERLAVKPGETAELVSSVYCYATLFIGGTNYTSVSAWNRSLLVNPIIPFVVAGPCEVWSEPDQSNGDRPGFITVRLLPDVADPAASLIVVPGTNAVTVRLESSTNLVDWAAAASVTLTNVPAATFYRAKLAENP